MHREYGHHKVSNISAYLRTTITSNVTLGLKSDSCVSRTPWSLLIKRRSVMLIVSAVQTKVAFKWRAVRDAGDSRRPVPPPTLNATKCH